MKKAILATKIGMTQIFNADGVLVPVTVLEAGPCVVTQIKTVENDGYSAVQVGFGDKKEKVVEKDANGKKSVAHRHGVNKAQMGHFKKAGVSGKRFVREFKFENADEYNLADEIKADIFADDSIFGVEINEHLVHMAVLQQLANKRQGTQKAKTRSEVRGGGRKPWRQKGTGHARQGSTRSPQWTGGGVVFAPTPRDYSFKLNKKEKRAALKSALTSRVVENKFVVVDELKLDEIKTKKFVEVLKNLNVEKALVVLNDMDEKVIASAANIPTVKTTQTNELNVFDVLKYDTVVVTKAAVATIEEVYA